MPLDVPLFRNFRFIHDQVVQQRDQYYMDLEGLKRNATPRPDWYKCAEYIYGGLPRWQAIAVGKSSEEMLQILLQEMTGGDSDVNGMQGKASLEDDLASDSESVNQLYNPAKAFACLILLIIKAYSSKDVLSGDLVTNTISTFVSGESSTNDEDDMNGVVKSQSGTFQSRNLSKTFRKTFEGEVPMPEEPVRVQNDNILERLAKRFSKSVSVRRNKLSTDSLQTNNLE